MLACEVDDGRGVGLDEVRAGGSLRPHPVCLGGPLYWADAFLGGGDQEDFAAVDLEFLACLGEGCWGDDALYEHR